MCLALPTYILIYFKNRIQARAYSYYINSTPVRIKIAYTYRRIIVNIVFN